MSGVPRWNYKRIQGVAKATIVLLGTYTILCVLFLSVDIAGTLLFDTWNVMDGEIRTGSEGVLEVLMGLLGAGVAIGCLLTGVVFCIWAYRAAANIRAIGETYVTVTPGGAVGWWFVPIANLWKPLDAIREIYQGSANAADGEERPLHVTPKLLKWWWAFWLLNGIGFSVSRRFVESGSTTEFWLLIALTLLNIGAAVCAITIVHRISGWQSSSVAAAEAVTPVADS